MSAGPRSSRLVAAWTRLYTAGLPSALGERRRLELESDLWEQLHDPTESHASRLVLGRWLRGVPADLGWRYRTLVDARRARLTTPGDARVGGRGWWVVATALLGVAKIVMSVGASVFANDGAVIGPVIAATLGSLTGGLVLAGLVVRHRNLVNGSWLIVAGCVAGFDPILLPFTALVVIGGVWSADLQFSETVEDEPRLHVAYRQQLSLTRRWYVWLAAAPLLFGFGLLFPLFVYSDTTGPTDGHSEGLAAIVDIVAWMTWWGSWLAAAVCAGVGLVLGVLRGVVHHRATPA